MVIPLPLWLCPQTGGLKDAFFPYRQKFIGTKDFLAQIPQNISHANTISEKITDDIEMNE